MLSRLSSILTAAFIASLCLITAVTAGERRAYDQKAFADAQLAGKPILIDITAPWCPVCGAQRPIIDKLAAEPRFKDLVIFEVDFDGRKDVLRGFGAQSQSTLIVFKGATEAGRSIGSTDTEDIGALLGKVL